MSGAPDRGDAHAATTQDQSSIDAILAAANAGPDDAAAAAAAATEAEATAAAAAAAAAAQPRDSEGKFIPKARFDEAVLRERSARELAERRLSDLEAQQAAVSRTVDVQKIETTINELRVAEKKAMMGGDEAKAVQLSTEIDRLNRQIIINETAAMSSFDKEAAREEIRVEMAVEKLQELYPQLNADHDTFDEGLTNFVLAEQNRLISAERLTPAKALVKAAQSVMERFKPAEAAAAAPAAKGLAAAAAAKAGAAAKNVDAAKKQPPGMKDVGLDSTAAGQNGDVDPTKLSFADFAALPEATKARLRGDLL